MTSQHGQLDENYLVEIKHSGNAVPAPSGKIMAWNFLNLVTVQPI